MKQDDKQYRLADGAQVRGEDFGLLFYTMDGPRLYFVSCGELLDADFFDGNYTLSQWLAREELQNSGAAGQRMRIEKMLRDLTAKGVVREC
jgi:putative mycofactocin binding protein MftB